MISSCNTFHHSTPNKLMTSEKKTYPVNSNLYNISDYLLDRNAIYDLLDPVYMCIFKLFLIMNS